MRGKFFKNFSSALVLGLLAMTSFALRAEAASMSFRISSAVVHQGQEIAVDILLDTEGETINTIAASIVVPQNLEFIGSEDGMSIISLWVDDPVLSANGKTLSFSGIIPGGFTGQIDPFDPEYRAPGNLIRLVFKGRDLGPREMIIPDGKVFLNDGQGTRASLETGTLPLFVDSVPINVPRDVAPDTEPPMDFKPILTRDVLLYDGRYVLIFNTKDKGSGMSHYEVKEGEGDWVRTTSPYELHDQSRSGDIQIKAVDRAGNERVVVVRAPRHFAPWQLAMLIVGAIALLGGIFVLIRHSVMAHRHRQ